MSEELYDHQLKEIKTDSVKCQTCGGMMIFDPDTQTLKCEHCGNTINFEKNREVRENDINEGFKNAEQWDPNEQATYRCENCGATIVVGADETATACPFCGTSHIVKSGSFKGLRPQAVIPFQFGEDKASEYCKKWAKSRIFAPRKFKKTLKRENMHGIYEPCFTFDSNTTSVYSGRVGYRRTRTVGSGKNRRTETYIEYKNVSGTLNKFFDDVLISNNENFDQKKLNSLAPFKTKAACVYEHKYLSGFVADGYTKDLKDGWSDAKRVMDADIRESIKRSYNADVVDYLNVSTTHNDVTYKYMLLPVYLTTYKYGKKRYGVMVNASTGKVRGKTPVSPLRVIIAVLLGICALAGLAYFFMRFGSSGEEIAQIARNSCEKFILGR